MKSDYKPRISFSLLIWILVLFLLAGLVSWWQYGFKKHYPTPVSVILPQETKLIVGEDSEYVLLKPGEQVSILACENRHFWVETVDHSRGLIYMDNVPHWKSITEREDMKYELQRNNCINISYEQMKEQYLGRTFEENETNSWPALYYVHKGDKSYATYLLRVWNEGKCYLPTVCYMDNKAVDISIDSEAPFKGNIQWLKYTPWAQWLYSSLFFHWHWDRPMIENTQSMCDSWWWIFRIPFQLILLILGLVVSFFWVSVVFGVFVLLMMCLIPLRYPFWHLDNSSLTILMVLVTAASCYFFMPFLLIDHGGFLTIFIMVVVFCILSGFNALIIQERCEECRCFGYIDVVRKEYTHTETTESEEKVLDKEHSTMQVSLYQIYKVTKEQKYYDHYCVCKICQNESIRKDQLGESNETKEPTGKFVYERHSSSSSRSSASSSNNSSDNSGGSSSSPDNPFTPFDQQPEGGNTCLYCKYFYANSCKYYDAPQYVNPNSRACWNFSA